MAKTIGPLFSLRASQSIGKTLTYAAWKGIPYVRTLVIPANPQSTAQTEVRNTWSTLNELFKRLGTLALAPWTASAVGNPYTNRNKFLGSNQPLMYDQTDMQAFVGSPGVGGAPPVTSATPSDATGQVLNLAVVNPTPPTGWTQTAVVGVAFEDGDPQAGIIPVPFEAQDAATPFTSIDIDVMTAGTYVWACWPVYTNGNGDTVYGPSVNGTQVIA